MMHPELKVHLDRLASQYGGAYLGTDPIQFPHRYRAAPDREMVGLLASSLAYGSVVGIRSGVEAALSVWGKHPAAELARTSPQRLRMMYRTFRYRFTSGEDLAALLWVIREMQRGWGSVGEFFLDGYGDDHPNLKLAIQSFVRRALTLAQEEFYPHPLPPGTGLRYLLPSPEQGSGCKRLNLFLRWMVRRGDGIDFGLWTAIPPRKLLMPVDTHVARLAAYLGLTRRRSPDWRMIEEITASLRKLDPEDPVRYDFSLSRLGILDECPRRRHVDKCARCAIRMVCQL